MRDENAHNNNGEIAISFVKKMLEDFGINYGSWLALITCQDENAR